MSHNDLKRHLLEVGGQLGPGEPLTADMEEASLQCVVDELIADNAHHPVRLALIAVILARHIDS